MNKKYIRALFIFRRDLRLDDNTGLIKALTESQSVIPCFIFDPAQVSEKNRYKSSNALQFMLESLQDLNEQLKKAGGCLHLFSGKPDIVVGACLGEKKIDAVFVNHDYTPYSIKRDKAIQAVCKKHKVDFVACHDVLLNPPGAVTKNDGKPYTVFSAYFKKALTAPVAPPVKNTYKNSETFLFKHEKSSKIFQKMLPKPNKAIAVNGGACSAQKVLRNIAHFKNYAKTKDYPSEPTTLLAAHLKFGTCSVRQAYEKIKKELGGAHPLIRQLYWRDFFTTIAYHFPAIFGHAFNKKYERIAWDNDKKLFAAWCQGKIGFPIVDAGMRQLNQTGFMHNRVRMIVASFLTKDLHIDWRWGERYFAQKLVDYDPSVNNGNWQWSASTGCDAQPYFRIFNPWIGQKKYDAQALYVKAWVPELADIKPSDINAWFKKYSNFAKTGYPTPVVDHAVERKRALVMYKNSIKRPKR